MERDRVVTLAVKAAVAATIDALQRGVSDPTTIVDLALESALADVDNAAALEATRAAAARPCARKRKSRDSARITSIADELDAIDARGGALVAELAQINGTHTDVDRAIRRALSTALEPLSLNEIAGLVGEGLRVSKRKVSSRLDELRVAGVVRSVLSTGRGGTHPRWTLTI